MTLRHVLVRYCFGGKCLLTASLFFLFLAGGCSTWSVAWENIILNGGRICDPCWNGVNWIVPVKYCDMNSAVCEYAAAKILLDGRSICVTLSQRTAREPENNYGKDQTFNLRLPDLPLGIYTLIYVDPDGSRHSWSQIRLAVDAASNHVGCVILPDRDNK
jgi:hypothetical protein